MRNFIFSHFWLRERVRVCVFVTKTMLSSERAQPVMAHLWMRRRKLKSQKAVAIVNALSAPDSSAY